MFGLKENFVILSQLSEAAIDLSLMGPLTSKAILMPLYFDIYGQDGAQFVFHHFNTSSFIFEDPL